MRVPIIIFLLAAHLVYACATVPAAASLAKSGESPLYVSNPSSAWTQLLKAFADVKTAEAHGAPKDSIQRLSLELDTALSYYENSTLLAARGDMAGSSYYATLSTNQSSSISSEAQALDNTARNIAQIRLEITIVAAFLISALTATTIIEFDRLQRFARRLRPRETNP